jgi:ArsR family transcriptional regulator
LIIVYIGEVLEMLSNDDCVYIFKALADGTRLRIIEMLAGGELCACRILEKFDITQPTLSYHMRILTESGIVTGVRDGAWMRYSINSGRIADFKEFTAGIGSKVRA